MKEQLKHILRKWPALYRFVEAGHRTLQTLRFIVGKRERERERMWAMRDISSAEAYWSNRNNPAQVFFAQNICSFNFSPSSILEIGSNCGPNLYQLAQKFPNAKIVGVDINKITVQKGNEWFKQEGISNVKLLVSKADELKQFPDKSFDVVFTWAVLILIGPDKIKEVMKEMIRITRKGLILLEMYDKDKNKGLGFYYGNYWKRDYVVLLRQFIPDFPEDKIHITKFPEDLWNPGGGGTLVEFDME